MTIRPDQVKETSPTLVFAQSPSARIDEIFEAATAPMIEGPTKSTSINRPTRIPPDTKSTFFQRRFGRDSGLFDHRSPYHNIRRIVP